eukprot:831919-Pyramimonas_sp.AAC.1
MVYDPRMTVYDPRMTLQGKPVGVVGGGDSALEEAVYLTKYAAHVHLFVRTNKMRASKAMQVGL